MAHYTLNFGGDKVGLIVRGKKSHKHDPGWLEQHADCILSNGAPMGFFGEGHGGASSGASSGAGGSSARSGASSGSIGLGLDGAVYDLAEMKMKRPYYVDGAMAKGAGVYSAVLCVPVSAGQAKKFDTYWSNLDANPATFYMVGGNCSTRASGGFIAAGILAGGIPGLDTPDNLWHQLCRVHAGKVTACYGYVGFTPKGSGFVVEVEGL